MSIKSFVRNSRFLSWLRWQWPLPYLDRWFYRPLKAKRDILALVEENRRAAQQGTGLQAEVLRLIRQFEPKRALDIRKIRMGGEVDGAYVMLDEFSGIVGALSMGVGDNVDWDLAIADRGIAVHQFDHTVEAPPATHPLIRFHPIRIDAQDGPGATSIKSAIDAMSKKSGMIILKIDIENHEWPAFDATPEECLAKCAQILCEFHGFEFGMDHAWLATANAVMNKLKKQFEVVHVHGNNYGGFVTIANVSVPVALEVTLANRARYRFEETDERFPTELDRPNNPTLSDLQLGNFKY